MPRKKKGNWRQKECDELLQKWGRQAYKACVICGKPSQVLHHFFPKGVSSRLRYDIRNCVPLDNSCHCRLHQSGDPSYEQRIISYYGQDWYNKLYRIRRDTVKANVEYYEGVRSYIESLLASSSPVSKEDDSLVLIERLGLDCPLTGDAGEE